MADGRGEFTATTETLPYEDISTYLHENGYLPGRTPDSHFANLRKREASRDARRTRGQERLPAYRPSLRLRAAAEEACRLLASLQEQALPEELCEQT